ncbi:MAG: hypothetical protein ROR55_20115 [Devosia sp.]
MELFDEEYSEVAVVGVELQTHLMELNARSLSFESMKSEYENKIPELFSRVHVNGGIIVIPQIRNNTIFFPRAPYEHDEVFVGGVTASHFLQKRITCPIFDKVILSSAHPNRYLFIELPVFDYRLIEFLYTGNWTTPFFISNSNFSACFVFDYDLEYSFFSCTKEVFDLSKCCPPPPEWNRFFAENYARDLPKDSENYNYNRVLENYLLPSIDFV